MGIAYNTSIVTSSLIFSLDAGNTRSYSGSGITAYGLVGGIGGTLINGVGFTSSNYGSFIFDGTNDYLQFTTDPLDLGTSNFSVSVWFKSNAAQMGSLVANQVSNGWNGFNFQYNASGYLIPTVDWGNSQQYGALHSSSAYNDNVWREATFVMNGATVANWKLYINGVQVNAPLEGSSVSTISGSGIANTVPFTIGFRQFGNYFSGQIGKVQIYNRALPAQEISQNFNATRDRYGI
jgi:hypothetical protein